MKLIIDIFDDVYKSCQNLKNSPYNDNSFYDTAKFAIGNGIPLDDAIKEAQAFLDEGDKREFEGNMRSGHHVFNIFVKHTGKEE